MGHFVRMYAINRAIPIPKLLLAFGINLVSGIYTNLVLPLTFFCSVQNFGAAVALRYTTFFAWPCGKSLSHFQFLRVFRALIDWSLDFDYETNFPSTIRYQMRLT